MSIVVSEPKVSEHWYSRDGMPMYTVESAKGAQRPTTLRDARKLNLVPSVTTIINVAAKPALTQWLQKQVLMAALTLPKINEETEEQYIARIILDAKEQGKAAADRGTEIHEAIQKAYEDQHYPFGFSEFVTGCQKTLEDFFGKRDWICERSFAHDLGYGGKCDLHCDGLVVDIKTKEFAEGDDVTLYDDYMLQLAAYRVGLGMPEARCANVFVSRNNPGVVSVYEWPEEDIKRGWAMFCCLLEYWQLRNNHV